MPDQHEIDFAALLSGKLIIRRKATTRHEHERAYETAKAARMKRDV